MCHILLSICLFLHHSCHIKQNQCWYTLTTVDKTNRITVSKTTELQLFFPSVNLLQIKFVINMSSSYTSTMKLYCNMNPALSSVQLSEVTHLQTCTCAEVLDGSRRDLQDHREPCNGNQTKKADTAVCLSYSNHSGAGPQDWTGAQPTAASDADEQLTTH